ncbi:hypothetical protein BSPP4475_18050 [Brevibacillus aydinogluensis]|uniref:Uncharacterized protein n=1 Tax=Brevibacillus aydinogluensis TaxID=927786 RepID=A0AA48MBL7_9BACL|nr:hypothetical protein BSPP4475_18050 [Brevibacillus aydinogluensis]
MYAIFFPCPGRFSLRSALKRSEANQPLAAAAEKKKSPDSRTQTKDKRFIELASTKNDFQAGRPAHSSTEAEDNGHRMEGWAKRAPLTTGSAEKRRRGDQQGTQVSLPRNTQMFVPCPRLVLERTSSASLLGVKRASGADLPCAADFVYTLSPDSRTQTKDKRFIELASTKNDFQAGRPAHSSTEAEDNGHRMEGWAKRAPLTTGSAEKRRRGDQQGTQVSLPRNTQMFVPCPRLVLERTSSASLLGVKRASGADLPCAADFVYTLSPDSRTQTKDNLHFLINILQEPIFPSVPGRAPSP